MSTLLILCGVILGPASWPSWRGPRENGSTAPADGSNAVLAFDWSGRRLWQTTLGREEAAKHPNSSPSNPSPVTDGTAVFVYFKSGYLAALELDGTIRWRTNLITQFGKENRYWGLGTSPALTSECVIMARIHEGDSWLAAFDKQTGTLRWKVARNYETPRGGDHGYTTPIVFHHEGREAILVWGAQRLTAHDAADGKLLWSCGGFNPDAETYWPAVASPVLAGGIAVVPCGRADRGKPRLHGIKLGGSGDVTDTHRLWERKDTGPFVPTPAEYEGRVYVLRDGGQLDCIDPQTGTTIWNTVLPKGRGSFYASPRIAGDTLYAVRDSGIVYVGRVNGSFELLAEIPMGERIIASPVPVSDRLLIRGERHLFCVGRPAKKLIEFGWDEPDTAFMRHHMQEMEKTPFDGCVFHVMYAKPGGGKGNFTWECWGKRAFTEAELAASLDDLKATPIRRFTANFLRFNTTPADIDWFDDFTAILTNARLAARLAREGRCRGILFDIEQYGAPLFEYRKVRDATTKSWEEYAAQVRLRGGQVMEAFQKEFPEVVVFLTFGYSLPWAQSQQGTKPLAECSYGLLAPLLDGMVDAARGTVKIVDGHELSYGYKDPSRFAPAYATMKEKLLPIVRSPEKYRTVGSFGFGLWLDHDWRNRGWTTEDPATNFFSPDALEASVRTALQVADEYVWIYSETPRWWSAEGKPVKLPDAYAEALRRARTAGDR